MSKNIPDVIVEGENKELIKSVLSDIIPDMIDEAPGLKTVTAVYHRWSKAKAYQRLNEFLFAANLDEEYILEIAGNEENQDLLLEYIRTVATTPSSLVTVALALVFRDREIGDSIKSLCAASLNGISAGTLNVFMQLMEYAYRNKNEECIKLVDSTGTITISLKEIGILKDEIELIAFGSDLLSRNICTTPSLYGGNGDKHQISLTGYSLMLYKNLEKAKRYLDD